MEFRILGPTEIYTDDGRLLSVTRPRQSATLSILLLQCDTYLTRTQLIEALWGFDQPRDPWGALRSYIYNLRKIEGIADRLRTHTSGYGIHLLENDKLDVHLFHQLTHEASEARRNSDHMAAARRLERALAIWRTPPLSGVPMTPAMQPLVAELLERRSVTQEALVDTWMMLGKHHDLLPMLKAFTAAEPLRERRWVQLMLALYRSGRQAEALEAYKQARAVLNEELGLDPGKGLQQLQKLILNNDVALDLNSTATISTEPIAQDFPPALITTPHQIPNAVGKFVGRGFELAMLAQLARKARVSDYSAVIVVISGPPGVGKSALAVQSAHQITANFPDGQLYVNLRGFAEHRRPIPPAEALRGILDSLGIPLERIPESLETRAALYRSLMKGRRVLVVVDDALDSDQVHHLVPASPGSMMIITCRRQLTNLVTAAGAQLINLDVLPSEDAQALLASRLTRDRAAAEADAIADLAELCGCLPLALAIIATRAAERPAFSLSHLAAEMRQSRNRLDALSSLEPYGDVRSAFSSSYATLTTAAARALRLMTLHSGAEIPVFAVASLADIPVIEARSVLRELTQMNLITERFPDRFSFHDLLRAYAAERLEAEGAA